MFIVFSQYIVSGILLQFVIAILVAKKVISIGKYKLELTTTYHL